MSVRKGRPSTSEPSSGSGHDTTANPAPAIKVNTVQNGLKKISLVLGSTRLVKKFNEILQLIEGPLRIARDKVQVLEESVDFESLSPIKQPASSGTPHSNLLTSTSKYSEYKLALIDSAKSAFDEELERAQRLLKSINSALDELDDNIEITSQRFLEEFQKKTKPELNQDFVVLQSCFEDCRKAIIFFKLKAKILKYFLCTTSKLAPENFDPFSHWKEYNAEEENCSLYLSKLETTILIYCS